ncbi:DUF6313 family protein [Streptomyces sp. NBC_00080]|uniref:DUF6313 family protein n=1 Tax=Streptomyces sp. NBC_00080 TaxID=2975645 RepID=UPI0038662B89
MRSLDELAAEGGEGLEFVTEFVNNPHSGNVRVAKDHWTRTVQHIADHAQEMESLEPEQAERRAENIARMLAHSLARVHKCWACGVYGPSTSWWRSRHD